jgi:hypothetical protein
MGKRIAREVGGSSSGWHGSSVVLVQVGFKRGWWLFATSYFCFFAIAAASSPLSMLERPSTPSFLARS